MQASITFFDIRYKPKTLPVGFMITAGIRRIREGNVFTGVLSEGRDLLARPAAETEARHPPNKTRT